MLTHAEKQTVENLFSKMSPQDLRDAQAWTRDRINTVQAEAAAQFVRGDDAHFFTENNVKVSGTILKINSKTVKLLQNNEEQSVWTVSPTLLNKGQ